MEARPQLICTLTRHVVTDSGDFIPAGTPVQVVAWSDDAERVEVRSEAYMYADSLDYESVDAGESHGNVGRGLWFSVDPETLRYKSCANVALTQV